ncbi:MAG: hypothetical protein Q4P17_03980 [Methanobacterium sp.]|nr:hypothetical protein [Methanobacterium sp.]
MELDSKTIFYIITAILALVSIGAPWIGLPSYVSLLSLGILLLFGIFYIIKQDNFSAFSFKMKALMVWTLLTSGITAILVFGISFGLIEDTRNYFTIAGFGIGTTTVMLAISGAISLGSFLILRLTAIYEGYN